VALSLHDPYATDETPLVSVNVGGKVVAGKVQGGTDITEVLGYSYTTDIITLTDTASIDVANPDGRLSKTIRAGMPISIFMADPRVNGGAKTLRLTGLVTARRMLSRGGERIQIQAADRGWYLEKCDAPLWANLSGTKSLAAFLEKMLKGPKGEDLGWGFQNADGSLQVASENDIYRRLNQGRAGIERSLVVRAAKGQNPKAFIPPIQVETGTKIGQLLIDYARRERVLVNVACDGTLLLWAPNYQQEPSYRLEYQADKELNHRNGVLDFTFDDSVEGIPTDVTCVTVLSIPLKERTNEDPNAEKVRGRYLAPEGTLPYYMRATFGDSDQVGKAQALARAKWFAQRAEFDASSIQCEVFGHQQAGIFWAPDTMVSINNTVHDVVGNYYLAACRYLRDAGGTRTQLRLHKAGLLAA